MKPWSHIASEDQINAYIGKRHNLKERSTQSTSGCSAGITRNHSYLSDRDAAIAKRDESPNGFAPVVATVPK
jgi:hypothetical protein